MPGTHVAIRTRTERAGDANEVKVLHGTGSGINLILRHATQPEERLEEVDQTDPAGRYRSYVNGDVWYFQRAASASWATATTLWQADANGVTFSIPQTFTVNDATANDVSTVLTLNHNTTGTPANSLGTRLLFGVETSTTVSTTAGLIDVLWTTVTHATRTSDMVFSVVVSAVTTEFLRLDGSASEVVMAQDVRLATGKAIRTSTTATNTLLLQAYDVDGGAYTTFGTLTAANTPSFTLDNITMSGTWLASGTVTLPAFTLGGAVTLNGQVFTAGATSAQINVTSDWLGLIVQGTWDTASGARVIGQVISANPAAGDTLLSLMMKGRDDGLNLQEYGEIRLLIEDPAAAGGHDGKLEIHLFSAGADNDALHLSSLGVLDVDASSGLGAATVGLFDDYDDALLLRQGISEKQLEVLESIGVMKRKKTGSGWMLSIQAMIYLLAGGIYQTRARMDNMAIALNNRLNKLELALPSGKAR